MYAFPQKMEAAAERSGTIMGLLKKYMLEAIDTMERDQ